MTQPWTINICIHIWAVFAQYDFVLVVTDMCSKWTINLNLGIIPPGRDQVNVHQM